MLALSSRQRAELRSLGHPLKPLVHIGKDGMTDAVVEATRQALAQRELIKIRVLENAPAGPRESANALAAAISGSFVVHVVGYTALMYRPHPETPELLQPR